MTTASNKTNVTSPFHEEKISGQNARLQIENSAELLALLSAEGIITSVSASITTALGYAPETIAGTDILALIHPDDADTMRLVLSEIAQTSGKSLSAEYRFRHQDESWRWFEGSLTNFLQVPGMGTQVGTFRAIIDRKPIPPAQGNETSDFEHFVQFYQTDEFLLNIVSNFIGAGLGSGETCIVIATKAHREGLEERLKANGLDLTPACTYGTYYSLDADEMLSKFMEGDVPEPERFFETLGSIIGLAAKGQGHLRVFGEMVEILWSRGKQTAAIHLEALWNDLYNLYPSFTLLCAYPMRNFTGETYSRQFTEICHHHSQVIPDENYILLRSDERLRAIALLQQQANSLAVEVVEHKEVEARFQLLFESSLIGVFISDFAGTVLDANDAFLDLVGYTRAEMQMGTLQRDILTPPEFHHKSLQALQALQEIGSSEAYEKEYLHKSGKRIPVLIAVTRIEHSDTCTGFVLDISERKELDQRKDAFINMASHELKTPITSLKGFLSLLQKLLTTPGEEKALYYLARMDTQVNKLTKLVNDLLDLSKIQTGKLDYRNELFDLQALMQEIVENIQGTTQSYHVMFESSSHVEVLGDQDRIGQVLINLLNNAMKYSPLADKVLVRLVKDQDKAIVSVQDFGVGIAQEHQQKIFERFYQINDSATKTYPGLGIGLHISNEIIKRHGGQMRVESEKDQGATFYFTLPLA